MTTPTFRRFEKVNGAWVAVLSNGFRLTLKSSDGTGRVGSRKGGWSTTKLGVHGRGDTRAEAVASWIAKDAERMARGTELRARSRAAASG